MMSLNLLFVVRAAALLLLPWSSVLVASQDNSCIFSDPISIHQSDQVYLEEYVNPDEGTFTIRIRYTGGNSWIGMGVNYNGESQMAPAYAVIGQIENDGLASVQRYWIDSQLASGLFPLEDVNGHLTSSSFEQLNGESILTFTHDLIILDEDNGSGNVEYEHNAESTWIWAVGSPDNQWGSHQFRGSFKLPLSENCGAVPNEPVNTEQSIGTADPASDSGSAGGVVEDEEIEDEPASDVEVDEVEGTDQDVTTTEPVVQSDNEGGTGNVASVGPASSPSTGIDNSNVDVTDVTNDTESGIVFSEENDLEGARSLWNAHGMCMGLAWGLFAPLAIGAAILRSTLPILRDNANGLRCHFWFNVLVVLLTVIGFALAVVATHQESGELQYFTASTHSKAGFSVLILVLVHVWAAFFRPSLPKKTRTTDGPVTESSDAGTMDRRNQFADSKHWQPKEGDVDNTVDGDDDDCSTGFEVKTSQDLRRSTTVSLDVDDAVDVDGDVDGTVSVESPTSPPRSVSTFNPKNSSTLFTDHQSKSMLRRLWESIHRFVGMTLLGLAWYNCHSGILILSSKYFGMDQEQLLTAFWTVAGGISALIFFVAYVIRM
jgi:hypothetical protein